MDDRMRSARRFKVSEVRQLSHRDDRLSSAEVAGEHTSPTSDGEVDHGNRPVDIRAAQVPVRLWGSNIPARLGVPRFDGRRFSCRER